MEKNSRTRLLNSALDLLGGSGAASLTVRAVEDSAGLPHGSVRHHFGGRSGMVAALFSHLADREAAQVHGDPAAALEHWLGEGRILTLARYELFLMAARDPTLRAALLQARDRYVAVAAAQVGSTAAPTVVAALDGLLLDALVRGGIDSGQLRHAVEQILGSA